MLRKGEVRRLDSYDAMDQAKAWSRASSRRLHRLRSAAASSCLKVIFATQPYQVQGVQRSDGLTHRSCLKKGPPRDVCCPVCFGDSIDSRGGDFAIVDDRQG